MVGHPWIREAIMDVDSKHYIGQDLGILTDLTDGKCKGQDVLVELGNALWRAWRQWFLPPPPGQGTNRPGKAGSPLAARAERWRCPRARPGWRSLGLSFGLVLGVCHTVGWLVFLGVAKEAQKYSSTVLVDRLGRPPLLNLNLFHS